MSKFTEWIKDEIEQREWSQNEFARRCGFSKAHASRVLTEYSPVSTEFCKGVAHAFRMSEVAVLREAGIISQPLEHHTESLSEMTLREIIELVKTLNLVERQELLKLARARYVESKTGEGSPSPATGLKPA